MPLIAVGEADTPASGQTIVETVHDIDETTVATIPSKFLANSRIGRFVPDANFSTLGITGKFELVGKTVTYDATNITGLTTVQEVRSISDSKLIDLAYDRCFMALDARRWQWIEEATTTGKPASTNSNRWKQIRWDNTTFWLLSWLEVVKYEADLDSGGQPIRAWRQMDLLIPNDPAKIAQWYRDHNWQTWATYRLALESNNYVPSASTVRPYASFDRTSATPVYAFADDAAAATQLTAVDKVSTNPTEHDFSKT